MSLIRRSRQTSEWLPLNVRGLHAKECMQTSYTHWLGEVCLRASVLCLSFISNKEAAAGSQKLMRRTKNTWLRLTCPAYSYE